MMHELYIGLMSGTSIDAIDAVLVDFNGSSPQIIDTHTTPFTDSIHDALIDLCQPGPNEIQTDWLAKVYRHRHVWNQ